MSNVDNPKTIEEMLFSLIISVSTETENYIESKGRLIRLPMQSRTEPILNHINALRRADMEAVIEGDYDEERKRIMEERLNG